MVVAPTPNKTANGLSPTKSSAHNMACPKPFCSSWIINSKLANSSVNYGGVTVSLGGSDTTPAFDLADATNYEGTAVKSTGESGGSKFLREDGDGTCSWQSPGGGGTVTTSGTPVDDDFAKFTDATTIEGRSYSEVKSDLGLGTAAERAAEDTLTDGSNLPDGAAIKAYGDSNWRFKSISKTYKY